MPSVLTPFVRSDAQGEVLAETFLHPDEEMTLAELSRRTDVLPAVVHKEVSRLVDMGVLLDRRQGNNRLVRVNQTHPLFDSMEQILLATYGPVPVLRELLTPITGVEKAFIYGSWAARRNGATGPFPHDIDVLVVGMLSLDDVVDIETEARDRLGIDVNIHRVTPEAWRDSEENQFLSTVKARPLVALLERGPDGRPEIANA